MIGIEGMPSDLAMAGNVVYKELKYRLSMRVGPIHDCEELTEKLRVAFMEAPESVTYGAKIDFEVVDKGSGFCAPDLPENVESAVNLSTKEVFGGKDPVFVGGGAPFLSWKSLHRSSRLQISCLQGLPQLV